MESIAGFHCTGRVIHGPAADLHELDDGQGLLHTAIVFHEEYRADPVLVTSIDLVQGFLEAPMVTGLAELVARDRELGAFVYPTGACWSVAELLRIYSELGEPVGIRAALEFMYGMGEILREASEGGAAHGVSSHGGLTPWRMLLRPDGQLLVIGYGLPQVEILRLRAGRGNVTEDSFRYCPPERLEGAPEDLSSDLFAVGLVAFELMTGRPVYDGLIQEIRARAVRAEASRRIYAFHDLLPKPVQDLLRKTLRRRPGDRHPDGRAFLEEVARVLGGDVPGPSLADVMDRVARLPSRRGSPLEGGATVMAPLAGLPGGPVEEATTVQSRELPSPGRSPGVVVGAGARRSAGTGRPAADAPAPPSQPGEDAPPAGEEGGGEPAPAQPRRWKPVDRSRRRPPRLARRGAGEGPRRRSLGDSGELRELESSDSEVVEQRPRRAASLVDSLLQELGASPPGRGRGRAGGAPAGEEPSPPPVPPPPELPPPRLEALTASGSRPFPGEAGREQRDPGLPVQRGTPPVEVEEEGPFARQLRGGEEPPPPPPRLGGEPPPPPPGLPPGRGGEEPPPPPPVREVGGTVALRCRVQGRGEPLRLRLPARLGVAAAVGRMVGSLLPLRTELDGRIEGWYRFYAGGRAVPQLRSVAELAGEDDVELRFVANTLRDFRLSARGPAGPVELHLRLATAVPSGSLARRVAELLGLPPAEHRLACGGRVLDPAEILEELEAGSVLELVVP